MRDYLLGNLDADQRTALEERILCDPKVYEELLVVEQQLIDEYDAGSLSKLERHQFETHFLATAERHKELRFGKLLIGHPAPAHKLPLPFRKVPALAIAGALLACLAIIVFGWLMAQKSAEGLVRQDASLVVVTLSPSSIGTTGTTQLLTLPTRGVDVKLELELANTSFHNYKSQLFRESEALDTRDGLRMEAKGDHHIVPLVIAGGNLRPADYRVRLSGVLDSGEDQFVDNYYFRVTTQ